MKNIDIKLWLVITALCFFNNSFAQSCTRYVDPFIGTAATGHTFPGAAVPFGMVQLSPETGNFGWNYCSGYRYEDSVITGFSHTHLNGTGGVDLGDILFFPYQSKAPQQFVSSFSHSSEKASPGYYAVVLKSNNIKAELTASGHSGIHRYTFNNKGASHILVDIQSGLVDGAEELETHVLDGHITVTGPNTISGYASLTQWVDRKVFFVARFNRPFKSHHFIDSKRNRRLVLDFNTDNNNVVEARVTISAVSVAGAKKNSAEIRDKTFTAIYKEAVRSWEHYLNRFKAAGAHDQLTNFYTSIYHALIQPHNIADIDGRYRGADGKVHHSANGVFYSTFSLWDTYRAAHPLYTILCPERDGQMVESMLQHFDVAKALPVWTLWGKESFAMIGNHSVPVIVDAALKGIAGFNKQRAFAAIKATLTRNVNPKYNWELYQSFGYLPSDSVPREAVSRTLEAAYDDWCAALLARKLDKRADYDYFKKRSKYYINLFDRSTNLMRGKLSNGQWVRPFANLDSGQLATGGDYTEGNAWQYVWQVQQDIPGLINLMGGRRNFIKKLDSLFTLEPKVFGKGSTLDVTGLIGQYAHGNEPDHHVAYLYALAGDPAKTQATVRKISEKFYQNKPDGLAGNDDCGQMSAWYIFTAMGFYPVDPVSGRYILGAPQLNRITIDLKGKRKFAIIARNLSGENKYVESITLNGRLYQQNYISHGTLLKGGTLIFNMTAKPSEPGF